MTITKQADFPTSHDEALAFDAVDPLAPARDAFNVSQDQIYLVGHSLGPPPRTALQALKVAADVEWTTGLVGSWNSADWINLPKTVGARIARLIGVGEADVVVCDSVSINLFKLVGALLEKRGLTKRIIVDAEEFPTDQYILERLAALTGAEFVRAASGSGPDELKKGGVLVRSLVDYRTSEIANIEEVEAIARQNEGVVVWDLSHATGVLDLKLAEQGAKYAVGCTYKYLNGGPGAPAFLYVAPDDVNDLQTTLAGWLGHARPFAFDKRYEPAIGVQRFVAGTPPILSLSGLKGALSLFDNVSLRDVEAKAQCLGDMCLSAFQTMGLASASPPIGTRRGGHVSFSHEMAYPISRALADQGIKTDFRTPTTIRFGLSPLCLRYVDVWGALVALQTLLNEDTYKNPKFAVQQTVT